MDSARLDRYYKKLEFLHRNTSRLHDWMGDSSLERIKENEDIQSLYGIFHAAQNAIESIIDINAMISKDLINLAEDRLSNLQNIINKKVISHHLKSGIIELMGLRNRLVHEYNGIIDEFAWAAIFENISTMDKYHMEIATWLKQIKN